MSFKRIAVIGLGKVGRLAATLLHEGGFEVVGVDAQLPAGDLPFRCRAGDITDVSVIGELLSSVEAVLSCLPYHLNIELARAAHLAGIHYFDLTEDVPTTNFIIELSRTARGLMAPQCGLAPGFVGIVGASLAAIGGVLDSGITSILPSGGNEVLLKALVVIIVGGLGSVSGAAVGAVLIGLIDVFAKVWIPELSYFTIFLPMALVLVIKPTGLFGKKA